MVNPMQGGLPADDLDQELEGELQETEAEPEKDQEAEESEEQAGGLDPKTQAFIEKTVNKTVAAVAEQLRRSIQSQGDRSAHVLKRELNQALAPVAAMFERLKAVGHEVPPEVQDKLTSQVMREALTSVTEEQGAQDQQAYPARQMSQEEAAALQLGYVALQEMEQILGPGGVVGDDDPEYEEHLAPILDSEDPVEILTAIREAAIAKARRLGLRTPEAMQRQRQARQHPSSGKLKPAGGGSLEGKTAMELISMGLRRQQTGRR